MNNAEYAAYKGDDLLAIGTISEIAKKLNVKENTVMWWQSPRNKVTVPGKNKKKTGHLRKILIKLED